MVSIANNPAVVANGGYAVLKGELQDNPENLSTTLGGTVYTLTQLVTMGHFQDCANLLNLQGAVAGAVIPTPPLPAQAFQSRIIAPELMALTSAQRTELHDFLDEFDKMFGGIPLNDPGTWNSIIPTYFPVSAPLYPGYTQNTNQQLAALKTRPASRAETLFSSPGTMLAWQDISQAWLYT